MKKIVSLLAATLAVGVLACTSCGESETPKEEEKEEILHLDTVGGTDAQAQAINACLNTGVVCQINGEGKLGGESAARVSDLVADENSYVQIANKYGRGVNLMNFTYDIPETDFIRKVTVSEDGYSTMIEFNYPEKGAETVNFEFKLTNVTLGECSTVEGQSISYKFKLIPNSYAYSETRISEMTELNDAGTGYKMINYEQSSPYWETNNPDAPKEKQYYYVKTYGEIVYLAPDGNWGLIAEGKNYMEFYAGSSERPFIPAKWPGLEVGSKYLMTGNMSHYNGNIQLGFVQRIEKLTDAEISQHSVLDADKSFKNLTATDIQNLASTTVSGKQKLNVEGMMNGLFQVTGKIKSGTWYTQTGEGTPAKYSGTKFDHKKRNYFSVDVGGEEFVVAYDYHTAFDKTSITNQDMVDAFSSLFYKPSGTQATLDDYVASYVLVNGKYTLVTSENKSTLGITAGETIAYDQGVNTVDTFTFKGTVRYNGPIASGDKTGPFSKDRGVWNLVPFTPEHIAKANA